MMGSVLAPVHGIVPPLGHRNRILISAELPASFSSSTLGERPTMASIGLTAHWPQEVGRNAVLPQLSYYRYGPTRGNQSNHTASSCPLFPQPIDFINDTRSA